MIGKGQRVALREHIKDILKNFDVVQVPASFLADLKLPEQGRFFIVQPENPEAFWNSRTSILQNELNKSSK